VPKTPITLVQLIQKASEITSRLTVDELASLVDYLGDGDMESIRQQSWQHHVASILPKDNDSDAIHALWVVLIDIHSNRFLAKNPGR
jgi:hypothetical protein